MDGKSLDLKKDKINKLKELFPEILSEGKINPEKLRATLGEEVEFKDERYVLNWAGKSDVFKILQTPTTATLIPDRKESVNFNNTNHIFIEGENLEVLKILQKSYYGKIKMIYIDPPYNTGNDSFIYPDKFAESKEDYLKRIGQKDEEGYMTKEGLFQKNSKDSGHYHSNWMSMMYPRLFLARNLLREDGVIFISIGDEEVHNLKLIMNEIFGEDNFEGHIHWRRRHNQPNDYTKMIGLVAEHIISYSKNKQYFKNKGVGKIGLTGEFSNPDNDPRGYWASKPWKVGSDQTGSKYKILTPAGIEYDEEWMGEEKTYKELLNDNRIIFPDNEKGQPRKKYFKSEREKEGQCATNWWSHKHFGHNQEGNDETFKLFGVKNVFSNPKPIKLIKHLIMISNCKENDLIIDFFCGSSSSAHAIYNINKEDGLNRKFIMIQLPEILNKNDRDQKVGFDFCKTINKSCNIAEIGKERIRRVIKQIQKKKEENKDLFSDKENKLDLGFKVFKLQESNFKIWRCDRIDDEKELVKQLDVFADSVREGSGEENIVYELLIKSGFDLNSKIEKKDSLFIINDSEMIIAITKIDEKIVKTVIDYKPQKVIVLDKLFKDNDQLKTNTALQMKDAGIDFRTI